MAYWREASANEHPGFVNPYNFVRISNREVQRYSQNEHDGLLDGVILCSLVTKTPLIIPDYEGIPRDQAQGMAHKCGKNKNQGVPFFRQTGNGLPTIPGSEIRGVIRSAFETLDNGCFSVNNSNVASSRSPQPKHPGIIQRSNDGVWKLYKATKRVVRGNGEPTGVLVREWPRLRRERYKTQTFSFSKGAEVKISYNGSFRSLSQDEIIRAVDDYQIIVDTYCKNDRLHKQLHDQGKLGVIPKPDRWTGAYPEGSWPVFYSIVENGDSPILYLSPAQIGRTVYRNRVDDLLGSHRHCRDSSNMCETCHLFGLIAEENGSQASKLRFTDARLVLEQGKTVDDHLERGYVLRELSSPKPSSVEFYTARPLDGEENAAASWTYDTATFGYTEHDGMYYSQAKAILPGSHLEVRGRKFYLHHPVRPEDACRMGQDVSISCTKRNMTAEAIGAESSFQFRVYFEGLTEDQLKRLVWTLCIGENMREGMQLHKFGHAKPLGFGSAKVVVDDVLLRNASHPYSIDRWAGFDELFSTELPADPDERIKSLLQSALSVFCKEDADTIRDYLVVTNWHLVDGLDAHVSYPVAIDSDAYRKALRDKESAEREGDKKKQNKAIARMGNATATHQWFMGNRYMGECAQNEMTTTSIFRALPALPSSTRDGSVLVLPKLIRDKRDSLSKEAPVIEREATCSPALGKTQIDFSDETSNAGQRKKQRKASQQNNLSLSLGSAMDATTKEKLRALGLMD